MVGQYATPEADVTITHHLPPPEDDSVRDVSMSFVIPPQADASNLMDQDYDDFLSGQGFVTLSTPTLPRHLAGAAQSVRKLTGTIQTPTVPSCPILGQTPPTHSTVHLERPGHRTVSQEAHILPSLLPLTESFSPADLPIAVPTVSTPSIPDPGPSRLTDATSKSNPGAKFYNGPKSNPAPSTTSIITTKMSGKQPGIQSMPTSDPACHSANLQNTQISRQFPVAAAQRKTKVPAPPCGNTSIKSNWTTTSSQVRDGPGCETTTRTQTLTRGGAVKRPNSTFSNHDLGCVKGRIGPNPASTNSRRNVTSRTPPTGNEHSDPDSLDVPRKSNRAVTQSLVTIVLPSSESTGLRFSLETSGADAGDSSPSPDPPQTAQNSSGEKISRQDPEEAREGDGRPTVSELSPSNTVKGCRERPETSGWDDKSSEPTPRPPLAISPMRPSRKRASSAEHASDIEPDGASPDELEKRCLITESNWEGEVRGGGEGKVLQARRAVGGEKSRPSCKTNGPISGSLALTRRLKAKAVRESPRARKLRDKLAGRVVGGWTVKGPVIGCATEISQRGRATPDACCFPGNAGASTTASVAMPPEKGGFDRVSVDETTGPWMPYSCDNEEEGGVTNGQRDRVLGVPSFRSTLKRSTVPVEFRFELATRLGTGRGSATKEEPGPRASRSSGECGGNVSGSSRKRPKLGELQGGKNGEAGSVEPASSSRMNGRDRIGSHAGAWKGKSCSRSKISSTSSIGGRKRRPLIIPEGFRFTTEQRARDREKFDEAVRAKQEEKEQQEEEERAAKAVEEEREIKKMRMRTVPKANGVPEWYAGMPKRKAA